MFFTRYPLQTGKVVNILYEDAWLMVLDKPTGLVVHGGESVREQQTLCDQLVGYFPPLKDVGEASRPGLVHRLDKHTEGLMVVAKTQESYLRLREAFKNRTVKKKYYAMVRGNVLEDDRCLEYALVRRNGVKKMAVAPSHHENTKASCTYIHVLQRWGTKTLLDVQPITGRMHQIRVHLSHIGHPLVGDSVYGKKKGIHETSQLLQAYSLGFCHPQTQVFCIFKVAMSLRF